jgi:hypothetical protein
MIPKIVCGEFMFRCVSAAVAAALAISFTSATLAQEDAWRVRKSSGEAWTTSQGVQAVSLSQDAILRPGDTIKTGRNGRVLLVRGSETILVAPNSAVGIPAEKKSDRPTTITQQAGSILLEVDKRDAQHFEVETPYLAAVVKGTQFRVSVTASGTKVEVIKGQVEVADFKTGQVAQVHPGQNALSSTDGRPGLSLSGPGTLSPIENGKPRAPTIERIPIPKAGFAASRLEKSQARAIGTKTNAPKLGSGFAKQARHGAAVVRKGGGIRISSALGEVRLNIQKATKGLARGSAGSPSDQGRRTAAKDTIWGRSSGGGVIGSEGNSGVATSGSGSAASGAGQGSGLGASSGAPGAAVAATGPARGNGNGNAGANSNAGGNGRGNGNSGNGNNGNGNAGGNGNGNGNAGGNGNGNGNAGGNGNGNGNGKKS